MIDIIFVTHSLMIPLLVQYPHGVLVTSWHNIQLREKSATEEAIGMQRGYEQIGAW